MRNVALRRSLSWLYIGYLNSVTLAFSPTRHGAIVQHGDAKHHLNRYSRPRLFFQIQLKHRVLGKFRGIKQGYHFSNKQYIFLFSTYYNSSLMHAERTTIFSQIISKLFQYNNFLIELIITSSDAFSIITVQITVSDKSFSYFILTNQGNPPINNRS